MKTNDEHYDAFMEEFGQLYARYFKLPDGNHWHMALVLTTCNDKQQWDMRVSSDLEEANRNRLLITAGSMEDESESITVLHVDIPTKQ